MWTISSFRSCSLDAALEWAGIIADSGDTDTVERISLVNKKHSHLPSTAAVVWILWDPFGTGSCFPQLPQPRLELQAVWVAGLEQWGLQLRIVVCAQSVVTVEILLDDKGTELWNIVESVFPMYFRMNLELCLSKKTWTFCCPGCLREKSREIEWWVLRPVVFSRLSWKHQPDKNLYANPILIWALLPHLPMEKTHYLPSFTQVYPNTWKNPWKNPWWPQGPGISTLEHWLEGRGAVYSQDSSKHNNLVGGLDEYDGY